jgi:hypothetical protein
MAHVPSHHTAAAAVQMPQVPMNNNNNNTPIASSSSTNPRSRPNANNRLTSDHPTSSTYTQSLI